MLSYLCYDFTSAQVKFLRGSEWTPFVDALFMQQRAETRQLDSKLTAFYYNVMYMTVRVSH